MTSVDGWTYTYDAIGNPISKTNTNGETVEFTWSGRELTSWYSYDDGEIVKPMSFTYNADGIRTSKSYYDEVTEYVLDGSRIIAEIKNGSHIFVYIYDELGLPIGIKYRSSTTSSYEYFFFEKNLQGDIVAIYNDSGTKIASYVYDAWGNFTKTQTSGVTYSTADSYVYNNNPFTYRGYYYDSETGLYYLQTRYYDASIGRFINADGEMSGVGGNLIGYNLYAYGFNNPINMYDPTGEWPWLANLVGAVAAVAAAVVAVAVVATAAPAAICTLTMMGMYVGASYVTASSVATAVVATTAVVTAAYSADVAYSSVTGESVLLDTVFQGNTDAYNTGLAITSIATAGILEMAAQSPGVCFVEGTLIATIDGLTPIEKIKSGDMVWATNEKTGETELKQVVQTFVNETNELVHLTIGEESITATPEHPFYVPQKGWVAAIDLRAGDILVTVNGEYVILEQIQHEILEAPITVYNFEVEEFHTYHVGEQSLLVHNKCGTSKQFKSSQELDDHFIKHGNEFGGLYKNSQEYLDGANYVINNGTYVPEMNGYVRFFGANGGANYAFVGLTRNGANITTFSVRSVKSLTKISWLIP